MTHIGFDVSHWQNPDNWDQDALAEASAAMRLARGHGLFLIARATYGANTEDDTFVRYHEIAQDCGLVFGAYMFYRQTHSAEQQLAAWQRQMDRIGGLHEGNVYPVLDMEHNGANGDGSPSAKLWNRACDAIGDAWKDEYGGAVLYYSSFFPDYLGAHKRETGWQWMHEPGYHHWLADYSSGDGNPRNPYTPMVAMHQPKPRRTKMYAGGQVDVDHNFAVEDVDLSSLLMRATPTAKQTDDIVAPRSEYDGMTRVSDGLRMAADFIAGN